MLYRKSLIGEMAPQNIRPPRNNIIKIKMKPNLPILKNLYIASPGRKEANIFEPSRGGMGKKLKIARKIFM